MGLLESVTRSLREDAATAAAKPREAYEEAVYVASGVRAGEIHWTDVAKSVGMTLAAFVVVAGLLFPVYWVVVSSLNGSGGSLYQSSGFTLLPTDPAIGAFLWVLGDLIVPSYTVAIDVVGYTVSVSTPSLVILDVSNVQRGLFGLLTGGTPKRGVIGRIELFGVVLFGGIDVVAPGSSSTFMKHLGNSLYVSTFTVLFAMSFVVPAAYALSRREFIARGQVLYLYVLFTQVGGGLGIAGLVALYALFNQLDMILQSLLEATWILGFGGNNVLWHLGHVLVDQPTTMTVSDNRFVLALYYAATAVPFNTWLLKTYMDGIPTSYEEAAYVDGAPTWRIVVEIIIPLSKAGLATVFIFTFLTGWMEFVVAQTILSTEHYTLPVGLYGLLAAGKYSTPWAQFSAYALTFASPIVVVYLFAQRYIEGGLSFGGMEG